MANQKDNSLFSFVPKGVPMRPEGTTQQPASESLPLSSPDSFQDFFRLLGKQRVWGEGPHLALASMSYRNGKFWRG